MTQVERVARAASLEQQNGRAAWSLADLSETRRWAYLLLLPSLILVAAVALYPVASGVWLGFQRYNLLRNPAPVFIGLGQYADLWVDSVFWTSVRNTAIWVVVGACSQFLLGLVTALALNRPGIRGLGFLRVGLLLPWLMPTVVAGHMWSLLLDSRIGVFNDLLVRVGLLQGYVAWFAQAQTAMGAVLLVDLWKNFPFFTLLLLAGLQGVPDELYEAAEVDGANALQTFWNITIPQLRPMLMINIILITIQTLNSFDMVLALTGGGPGQATEVLALHTYNVIFRDYSLAGGAVLAVIMLLISLVITLGYRRLLRSEGVV
jgi:multiple sugar transport system permease protein